MKLKVEMIVEVSGGSEAFVAIDVSEILQEHYYTVDTIMVEKIEEEGFQKVFESTENP